MDQADPVCFAFLPFPDFHRHHTSSGGRMYQHARTGGSWVHCSCCHIRLCVRSCWLAAVKLRSIIPKSGHRAVLLTVLTLPFLLVRIIYFLLLEYGPPKFNPATGYIGILVGMGLLMEIIIVVLLLTARAVAEPVWPSIICKRIVYDDLESMRN